MPHLRITGSINGLVLALIVLGATHTARADDTSYNVTIKSVRVAYADLNLKSESGARTLMLRIKRAAKRVCLPEPDYRAHLPRSQADFASCRVKTTQDAIARLDHSEVTALFAAKR